MKKLVTMFMVLVMALSMTTVAWAVTPPTNAVAQVGENYYTSLADAVTYALADETVTLLKDIELTERLTVATGKTVTLDLAGYTLTLPRGDGVARAILNEGTLTVNDSSAEKTGKIVSDRSVFQNWGTLIVNGGTFEANREGAFCALGNGLNDREPENPKTEAVATINGGVFKGSMPIINFSAATVEDGVFVGEFIRNPFGTLTIKGGAFDVVEFDKQDEAKIVISGGHFTADPSAYLASGKRVVSSNEDGYTWTIANKRTSRPNGGSEPTDQTLTSVKTFDAGIAVYAGMALASAAGAVYVTKKR